MGDACKGVPSDRQRAHALHSVAWLSLAMNVVEVRWKPDSAASYQGALSRLTNHFLRGTAVRKSVSNFRQLLSRRLLKDSFPTWDGSADCRGIKLKRHWHSIFVWLCKFFLIVRRSKYLVVYQEWELSWGLYDTMLTPGKNVVSYVNSAADDLPRHPCVIISINLVLCLVWEFHEWNIAASCKVPKYRTSHL